MGETFCFDFGYYYCLSTSEIIYSHFLISSSLIFLHMALFHQEKSILTVVVSLMNFTLIITLFILF